MTQLSGIVASLAVVTWAVMPRRNTAALLQTMGEAHAVMIRAAHPQATQDDRSNAERYAAKAQQALDEFWDGFTDWLGE
jgi:hypothetical protein